MSIRFRGVWIDFHLRFAWNREIAIHKSAPDFAPAAVNILTEAVVGNKITNVRIGYEDHVAVEINCVAAVSDNAHRVHAIFHESEAQAADHRMEFKLARFHLPHGFRFQNSDSIDAAILKKGEHETCHIRGGS